MSFVDAHPNHEAPSEPEGDGASVGDDGANDIVAGLPAGATPIDLPRGIALNTARLICPGRHQVTKFRRPDLPTRQAKAQLEAELGQPVFVGREFAYVSGDIDHPRGACSEVICDYEDGLHLFDLRSALAAQARRVGLDAWFKFGGEINVSGFAGQQVVGDVIVQPRLRLRVVCEGSPEIETLVIARARWRWLLAGTLADLPSASAFEGESAERLSGEGPRNGTIVSVSAGTVVIRTGDEEHACAANAYTVAARPGVVATRFGLRALVALQVASGSLTKDSLTKGERKNLYAVKDRFTAAADRLAEIGHELPMPNGDIARIEAEWTEVRVQEGS